MPTYEYSCEKCGRFEVWQSIKDNALAACPACGSKVQRLISANVGFVLKGAGFYQNDYKNPAPSPERKAKGVESSDPAPSAGSAYSTNSGQAGSPQATSPSAQGSGGQAGQAPSTGSGQGCGTCGSPDPCPNN